MPTGYNSAIYKDGPPLLVDAAPVIALRAAGALIFGKTTTTEFASTRYGGPAVNPHDPARTPGGPSSGSGAAVADFSSSHCAGNTNGRKYDSAWFIQWCICVQSTHKPISHESLTSPSTW
jgi:Asp-tRNA(Asn)/Glu-tRNA(Gln) amidotransferase A subunit family amidase